MRTQKNKHRMLMNTGLFLLTLILAISAVFPAMGGRATDALYKNVKKPAVLNANETVANSMIQMMTSALGEPETVPTETKKSLVSSYGEYISIEADGEGGMELMIGCGGSTCCWKATTGIQQAIALRAFTSLLPCSFSVAGHSAVWSELVKYSTVGKVESFDDFLQAAETLAVEGGTAQNTGRNEEKPQKTAEGDQYLAVFSRVSFGDTEEQVTEVFGAGEREEKDGMTVVSYSDPKLLRKLSDGIGENLVQIGLSFRDGKLAALDLVVRGTAGNLAFCKAYMTTHYGEPAETTEDGPEWMTEELLIRVTDAGDAMTLIRYQSKE